MKKTLLALALVATSFAASASTLVTADYGYLRATAAGPYLASHGAIVGVKQSFGALGNVKVFGGTVQRVSNTRDNGNTFGFTYSYDFATPLGQLSPEVGLSRVTGVANGVDTATVGALLRTPLSTGVQLVTGVGHTEALGSDKPGRTTSASVGAEVAVAKSVMVRASYAFTRLHTIERNANGLSVGVGYKF